MKHTPGFTPRTRKTTTGRELLRRICEQLFGFSARFKGFRGLCPYKKTTLTLKKFSCLNMQRSNTNRPDGKVQNAQTGRIIPIEGETTDDHWTAAVTDLKRLISPQEDCPVAALK